MKCFWRVFVIFVATKSAMTVRSILLLLLSLFAVACGNREKAVSGPIVMGDSSLIVTEADPLYLVDFVADVKLKEIAKDTLAAPADSLPAPTAPERPEAEAPAMQEGLRIPFKEITVLFPDIKVKEYRKQDPEKTGSVSYQLTEGTVSNNQLRVMGGGTVQKVSQRYISGVVLSNQLGLLDLTSLNYTSNWTTLKGSENSYGTTDLAPDKLEYRKIPAREIRNAVARAAKSKRLNRKDIQKWQISVDNIRSVNQPPFKIVLRSLMWKIEGKGDDGKPFVKQIRIDIPAS